MQCNFAMDFSSKNNFRGLQEFVNNFVDENSEEIECVIIPPEPDILTDEENIDDDDLYTFNLPQDVPGTLQVFNRNENSDSDSSDDEILAAKKIRLSKFAKRKKLQKHHWVKTSPTYTKIAVNTESVSENKAAVENDIAALKPHEIFEKLFDEKVLSHIVNQTNIYAAQNNKHDLKVTLEEIQTFIAILLFSGYHELPRQKNYWSSDEDLKCDLITQNMSRNRFLEIKRYIHLANNSEIGSSKDKMYKIRPLITMLSENFCQWGYFHKDLSIDESMVKYFGRHGSKQFMKGKPCRFGYKNWMLSSSNGYCYNFDVYCGRNKSNDDDHLPLGSKVVLNLVKEIESPANHVLYFDNFFTSHDLLKTLTEKDFKATGTIRENRTKKCPLIDSKVLKKKERGALDYRFEKDDEIFYVKWNDNKPCIIATNHDQIEPMGSVKRWSREQQKRIDVQHPALFNNYNQGMGGVDLHDQALCNYRISIRGKKWWWPLLTYIIDMCVVNAWKLYQLFCPEKLDLLSFRRNITRYYLLKFRGSYARNPRSGSLPQGLASDKIGHYPEKLQKRKRCVVCHKRGIWKCDKCDKTLCIEKTCFKNFHA